jgi:predicted DNA-binding transcriptional regulator
MNKDRVLGAGILVGSLLGVGLYFYLVFLSPWYILTVQLSAFVAVAAVLLILAWIGYTLATTPPPMPLEDVSEGLGEVGSETVVGGGEAEETEK